MVLFIVVVQGDWNAKIGPEAHENWAGTCGRFGLGKTNERGLRLLEFAELNGLVVTNTLHPHKESRLVTWISNDGQTENQIDYIMISKRFRSSVITNKTRAFPGADVGSDHNLVMMNFKLKLRKIARKKSTRVKYNVSKLKEPDTMRLFQAVVGGRYALLLLLDDVQEITDGFTDIMNETALAVLGKKGKYSNHGRTRRWLKSVKTDAN